MNNWEDYEFFSKKADIYNIRNTIEIRTYPRRDCQS